jgi:excisionase family DNA binding protein
MPLPLSLFDEVASTLAEAGRNDLVQKLKAYRQGAKDLTSREAAEVLGVSSPNTVKNWLNGGYFPGAYKTPGGHWRFPRAEVLATKAAMDELRRRNRDGDFTPSDSEGEEPLPLL